MICASQQRFAIADSRFTHRIIAATALFLELPLISRDRRIQLSDVDTIW